MNGILLSALTSAGVLERAADRSGSRLRVNPRFLAFAEGTAGRLRLQGRPAAAADALETALGSWEEFRGDPHKGAQLLHDLLDDGHQLGALQPVFPSLEGFATVA